jgi:acyl dehydratase
MSIDLAELAPGAAFAGAPYLLDESAAHAYERGVKEPERRRPRRQNIHNDPAAAARAGFNRPIAAGEHTIAVMMQLLVDRFGMGFLRGGGYDVALVKPVLYGDTIVAHAEVERVENGSAALRIRVENQAREAVLTGTARVRLGTQ